MELGLAGKVVLITGGSRGIGRSIAHGFADEGASIAFCARGQEQVDTTAGELRAKGTRVFSASADVRDPPALERFVESAATELGRIDILVNNAGGGTGSGIVETTDEQWRQSLELNFSSTVVASRAVIPHLRKQGGGAIVNISSISAMDHAGQLGYNAFKAAQITFGRVLAKELVKDNIRVVSVAPGSIIFPGGGWQRRLDADPEAMARWMEHELPAGRFGRPEEIANVVVFVASERASWVNGEVIRVDGLQSRWVF